MGTPTFRALILGKYPCQPVERRPFAMSASSNKTTPEALRALDIDQLLAQRLRQDQQESRDRKIARIGRLWERRNLLGKFLAWGGAAAMLIAIVIPTRYAATTRLMPPDPPAGQVMTLLGGLVGKMGANLASLGGDLLGVSTSVDLFAGLLESRTVQNDLVKKFNLQTVYRERHLIDAPKGRGRQTDLSID